MKNIWKFAILGFVLVALVACSAQPQAQGTGTGNAVTPPADTGSGTSAAGVGNTSGTGTSAAGNVVEINMTASQFAFNPGTITVHKGDHVIIHLTSADVSHGVAFQGYPAHVEVDGGQTGTVEFDATTAGTFTFYCDVPCGPGHREMRGTLTVL